MTKMWSRTWGYTMGWGWACAPEEEEGGVLGGQIPTTVQVYPLMILCMS